MVETGGIKILGVFFLSVMCKLSTQINGAKKVLLNMLCEPELIGVKLASVIK